MKKRFMQTDELGTLWYDYVLIEDAIPEFFIAIDSNQNRYLAVLAVEEYTYILTKISLADVRELIHGAISMAEPFLKYPTVYCLTCQTQPASITILKSKTLSSEQIPAEDAIFECDEDDIAYIDKLSTASNISSILSKLKSFCNKQLWEEHYA